MVMWLDDAATLKTLQKSRSALTAMKSGMLAAYTIFDALQRWTLQQLELTSIYDAAAVTSWLGKRITSSSQLCTCNWHKLGIVLGGLTTG